MQLGTALLVMLVASCAPAAPAPVGSGTQLGAQPQDERPRATGPKTLTVALQREYDTAADTGEGVYLLRDGLVLNRAGVVEPLIATELISVENGTWQINPDGT